MSKPAPFTRINPAHFVIITVKSTPSAAYQSQLVFEARDLIIAINRSKKVKVDVLPVMDRYVTVQIEGKEHAYESDREGNVFDRSTNEKLNMPDKYKKKLRIYGDLVANKHYGELVAWDQAKNKIPNKSTMMIIDMETGLAFQVQRRAGKYHADVQPLTKSDTRIMKQIYNGTWSWKRKAILVRKDNHYYAASMQGMPHGGDGIPDNGFSGHFCVHFLDSRVHKSFNKDPEHQLMVHKAAGDLDAYFQSIGPYELVDSFVGAVNLKEAQILTYYFADARHPQLVHVRHDLEKIRHFRKLSRTKKERFEDILALNIPVEVQVEHERKNIQGLKMIFHLQRKSLDSPWKIVRIEGISI